MTLHKLNPDRSSDRDEALPASVNLSHEFGDLADTVIGARALRLLRGPGMAYPIYRLVRFAIRRTLDDVFDDLAPQLGVSAFRLSEYSMLLDGPGVFI